MVDIVTGIPGSSGSLFGTASVPSIAQNFISNGTTVSAVRLYMFREATALDGVVVKIFTVDENHHPLDEIGASEVVPASAFTINVEFSSPIDFTFASPVPVEIYGEYALVVERTGALGGSFYGYATANASYPSGELWLSDSVGAWSSDAPNDLCSIITQIANDLVIGEPTGAATGFGVDYIEKLAQNFITIGTLITSVRLWAEKEISPSDGLQVKIYTVDENHQPLEQIGVTSTEVDASALTTTQQPVQFTFAPPVEVNNEGEYCFVVERTGLVDFPPYDQFYLIGTQAGNPYADGQLHFLDAAGAWQSSLTATDIVALISHADAPIEAQGFLFAGFAVFYSNDFSGSIDPVTYLGPGGYPIGAWVLKDAATGEGVLPALVATVAGLGVVTSKVTGNGALAASLATVAGNDGGIVIVTGTGALQSQSAIATGLANVRWVATGALAAQPATVTGLANVRHTGTGALAAQAAVVTGLANVQHTGTGALATQAAVVTGSGVVTSRVTGTGALAASAATVFGNEGEVTFTGSGALPAQSAIVAGQGTARHTGTGTLVAQTAVVAGLGTSRWVATGALAAQSATLAGQGTARHTGTGTLAAQAAAVSGSGVVTSKVTGTGALAAAPATLFGFEGEAIYTATGALQSQSATATGLGDAKTIGTGALAAQPATVAGSGAVRWTATGALAAQRSTVVSLGNAQHIGVGVLVAQRSVVIGGQGIITKPSEGRIITVHAGSRIIFAEASSRVIDEQSILLAA